MNQLEITCEPDGSDYRCRVRVRDERSTSTHTVHVRRSDLARWGHGRRVDELVRLSFEFLLEREDKASILSDFELAVIPRYFPDYDAAMRRRNP